MTNNASFLCSLFSQCSLLLKHKFNIGKTANFMDVRVRSAKNLDTLIECIFCEMRHCIILEVKLGDMKKYEMRKSYYVRHDLYSLFFLTCVVLSHVHFTSHSLRSINCQSCHSFAGWQSFS